MNFGSRQLSQRKNQVSKTKDKYSFWSDASLTENFAIVFDLPLTNTTFTPQTFFFDQKRFVYMLCGFFHPAIQRRHVKAFKIERFTKQYD